MLDYLRRVFDRVLNDWGFDLVKLDFLYGAAPFGNTHESRAARMYRAMELLRTWCGQKQILGCGVPVIPAFGLVDYCRVSCDVGLDWDDVWYMRLFLTSDMPSRYTEAQRAEYRRLRDIFEHAEQVKVKTEEGTVCIQYLLYGKLQKLLCSPF